MSQQEFKNEALRGVEKIGEGALEMIKSFENIIKKQYSNIGEEEARKLVKALNDTKLDVRVKEFEKQIKDLSKDLK